MMTFVSIEKTLRYRLADEELCGDHTWNDEYGDDSFCEIVWNGSFTTVSVNDDTDAKQTGAVGMVVTCSAGAVAGIGLHRMMRTRVPRRGCRGQSEREV